jgi:uncharacterized repeat protein (TIGR01451 family)
MLRSVYFLTAVFFFLFAQTKAQTPKSHLDHFDDIDPKKPCHFELSSNPPGENGHDLQDLKWDRDKGVITFEATTHAFHHSPLIYVFMADPGTGCYFTNVNISNSEDQHIKIRAKAASPITINAHVKLGKSLYYDHRAVSETPLVMNLTTEFQEFVLSGTSSMSLADFYPSQAISLSQIGGLVFDLGRTDNGNYQSVYRNLITIDFIELGKDAGVPSEPCKYYEGKVKLKERFTCSYPKAQYEVYAEFGEAPFIFNWFSNVNVLLSGDTSRVELEKGIHSFAVTENNGCVDTVSFIAKNIQSILGVDFEPFFIPGAFRTGFTRRNFVETINIGCQESQSKLKIILDPLITFVPDDGTYDEKKGDTLIWNIGNMNFDSDKFVRNLPLNTSVFAQIGDTVCVEVCVESTLPDGRIINNNKKHCLPVINGYDPNDIAVHPSTCPKGYFKMEDVLTYKIRFQNTGNAEAININVYDTLSKYLDWSTLQIISSSHDSVLNTYVHNDSVLQFSFDNIWLKDSTTNEKESHGYIIYQIRAKSGLPLGTKISAKADIYFDFNPPVVTNFTSSTLTDEIPSCKATVVGVDDGNLIEVEVYPNPSNGGFTINSNSTKKTQATIFDVRGNVVLNTAFFIGNITINEVLSAGAYLIQVMSENGEQKMIKLVMQ